MVAQFDNNLVKCSVSYVCWVSGRTGTAQIGSNLICNVLINQVLAVLQLNLILIIEFMCTYMLLHSIQCVGDE